MKTLKNLCLSILLVCLTILTYAQEPATITLVSSKNLNGATELVVDLDGEFTTDTWTKDYVRIEIEIKANDVSREVIKHLIRKARFCIKTQNIDSESMRLYMPNLQLPVYINGKKLSEDISYKISVPKGIYITDKSQAELLSRNFVRKNNSQ